MKFQTKASYVARYLRKQIIEGKLAPLSNIRQEHIAAELGLSPTPVREALRLLEAEGFVESVPHMGVRVSAPPSQSLPEVFELKRLVEGYAAELAAERITDAELDELERLNQAMALAVAQGDNSTARGLDYEFHEVLGIATRVQQIPVMFNSLWAGFTWDIFARHPDRMLASVQEHNELIRAFRARDGRQAREAMVKQVLNSRRDVLALSAPADALTASDPVQSGATTPELAAKDNPHQAG